MIIPRSFCSVVSESCFEFNVRSCFTPSFCFIGKLKHLPSFIFILLALHQSSTFDRSFCIFSGIKVTSLKSSARLLALPVFLASAVGAKDALSEIFGLEPVDGLNGDLKTDGLNA